MDHFEDWGAKDRTLTTKCSVHIGWRRHCGPVGLECLSVASTFVSVTDGNSRPGCVPVEAASPMMTQRRAGRHFQSSLPCILPLQTSKSTSHDVIT